MAPYNFTVARALGTNAQVICAFSKGKVSVFRYFKASTREEKAKPVVNFLALPSVKFHKIWQTGSKYITLVGVRFSLKSIRPFFLETVKDINLQNSKKTALANFITFLVFKIRIPLNAMPVL